MNKTPISTPAARPYPDLLLMAVTAMILTYVWRIQDITTWLASLHLGALSITATVLLLLLGSHPYRNIKLLHFSPVNLVVILFALMLLSMLGSIWPGKSISFLALDYLPTLLFMFFIAISVRSRRDIEWLVTANVIGGCIYSLFILGNFKIDASGRLGGLVYYDANDFALLLVCTIPFAFFLIRTGSTWIMRLIGLSSLALFIVMLIKSGSRGGLIAFTGVMLYLLLRYTPIRSGIRLGILAIGISMFLFTATTEYWNMMRTLLNPSQDYNWVGKEDGGRMEVWKRGLGYMSENPILGVGVRAFQQAEGTSDLALRRAERGRGMKWSAAHNSFVEVGAESGVPALLVFVGILAAVWRQLIKIKDCDSGIAKSLIGALLGFVVAGFFVSAWYFAYLYMLIGFAIALRKIRLLNPQPSPV